MRKGWPIAIGAVIVFGAIGSAMPRGAATTTPSDVVASETAAPTETSTPAPSETIVWSKPVLYIDDLGDDTCHQFEVCTFVNIEANKTCLNTEIYVDLYDENDEYFDTESVSIGTVKKGTNLRSIEVGTDDTDADYVEQSDYVCG